VTFVLRFDPSEIVALAARFGDDAADARPAALGAAAALRGHYTRAEFLALCEWKSARSRPLVAANGAGAVRSATRHALAAATGERERIEALLALRGVGMPTASVLLHFAMPDRYPILDVRALESLGVTARTHYTVGFWLEYLQACRELAGRHGVTLRTLDKALWQHSRERAEDRKGRAGRKIVDGPEMAPGPSER
jgi:hypothetical protein